MIKNMRRKLRKIGKRIKHHTRKVKPKHVGITLGCIIVIALFLFFLTTVSTGKTYEITETDILSLSKIKSSQVSVKGVFLGDSMEQVIEKIGYPDGQQAFPPDITNMEFGKRLNLEETGLILHFKGEILTRITIKDSMNELLVGKTKVGGTKTELFSLLGAPDSIEKIPVAPESTLLVSLYTYEDKGIELLIRKNKQNALSLFI